MTCPRCNFRMTPLRRVECKTGDAQLHRCPRCGAQAYEQITTNAEWMPLRERHRLIIAKSLVTS